MATIKDLYFYPIKSFRGLRVNEMQLEKQGPRYDREWMLVDEKGKFITQRTMPILAKIGVRMDEAGLELSAQGLGGVDFGLEEYEPNEIQVTVWKDTVPALEVSSEVSEWLSEFTGQKVKLVRFSPQAKRQVGLLPEREIRFADACPLLVISVASLKDLEKRTGVTLSMSRFRPSVVVDQVPAYAEDLWSGFETSSIQFKALKPCSRCKITCTHPLTGEVGQEPLHTLSTYRRQEKGVMFGYYYAHLSEGAIRVGETLKLS
jgi:uncharacterized protein YcbX